MRVSPPLNGYFTLFLSWKYLRKLEGHIHWFFGEHMEGTAGSRKYIYRGVNDWNLGLDVSSAEKKQIVKFIAGEGTAKSSRFQSTGPPWRPAYQNGQKESSHRGLL
jgi:hypothetical protein